MVREKLKTPEGRKFLLALLVVFMIAAACVGRATIVGVIEQYNIPLSARTTSMFVLQSAMIFVYSFGVHRAAGDSAGDFLSRWA